MTLETLWFVADLHSEWGEDDGWYVLADSANAARELVLVDRRKQYEQAEAERTTPLWPDVTDPDTRWRWYHGAYKPSDPSPDEQVGSARAVEGLVIRVPFLGYTW